MQKTLKKKLTISMMLTVLASMAIISVCLLLGVMRYSGAKLSKDVADVFTTDLLSEMNLAADGSSESAAMAVSQIIDGNAGRLGIDAGRAYSIWDVQSGSCIAGTQADVSITNNIVTAMNGTVGDSMPLFKMSRDIAVPISGTVDLVVDICDDGSAVRHLCWNIFALLAVSLILSLAMCFVLSNIFAGAFADDAMQEAQKLRRKWNISDSQLEKNWEVIALYEPEAQSKIHLRRRHRKSQPNILDTASKYLSEGYVKFSLDGTVLHINTFAAQLLGVDKNAENLTFHQVFAGVPIPTDKQRMVHGEFTCGEKRLDVVFLALEGSLFAAIVRPAASEEWNL